MFLAKTHLEGCKLRPAFKSAASNSHAMICNSAVVLAIKVISSAKRLSLIHISEPTRLALI
eukprot:11587035-Alexandrium_andersonii.AAC.1